MPPEPRPGTSQALRLEPRATDRPHSPRTGPRPGDQEPESAAQTVRAPYLPARYAAIESAQSSGLRADAVRAPVCAATGTPSLKRFLRPMAPAMSLPRPRFIAKLGERNASDPAVPGSANVPRDVGVFGGATIGGSGGGAGTSGCGSGWPWPPAGGSGWSPPCSAGGTVTSVPPGAAPAPPPP